MRTAQPKAKRRSRVPERDWHAWVPRKPEFYIGPRVKCLQDTLDLSRFQMLHWMGKNMLDPQKIIAVLQKSKIKFVVMGMYGISPWLKEPRATKDFDVLVPMKQVKKAVSAIQNAFPKLTVHDTPVVTRLLWDGEAVFDVMKPHHALFKEVFKHSSEMEIAGHKVLCPTLEMSLALKFFSMTGPFRNDEKSFQDAADFIRMVRHNNHIDEKILTGLCDLAFQGGSKEVLEKLTAARAGKGFTI